MSAQQDIDSVITFLTRYTEAALRLRDAANALELTAPTSTFTCDACGCKESVDVIAMYRAEADRLDATVAEWRARVLNRAEETPS